MSESEGSVETPALKFEFIEGKRKDSCLLYIPEIQQIYRKKGRYRSKTTYNCYEKGCKAKAAIRKGICKIGKIQHRHGSQLQTYNILVTTSTIKKDVEVLCQSEFRNYGIARKSFESNVSK